MRAKLVLEQTQGLHLHAKFHLNVFILSLHRLPVAKNHNFWQILTFGGCSADSLLPTKATFGVLEQTHGIRAKFRLDLFILLPSGGEKPQFLPFLGERL